MHDCGTKLQNRRKQKKKTSLIKLMPHLWSMPKQWNSFTMKADDWGVEMWNVEFLFAVHALHGCRNGFTLFKCAFHSSVLLPTGSHVWSLASTGWGLKLENRKKWLENSVWDKNVIEVTYCDAFRQTKWTSLFGTVSSDW